MRWPTIWRGGAAIVAAAALTFGLSVALWADDEEQEAQAEQTVEQDDQEQAGQAIRIPMSVTENREPGLMGSATITPLGNRMWRVEISMTGLPSNDTARPAHIHTAAGARCDTGAPVTYPLTNVSVDAMGRGTSVSTITVTDAMPIQANNAYVNVHNPAQMGRGVFCGNITVNIGMAGPGTMAGAGPAAQPGAQRPAGAPAQPAPQRPAAAPAAAQPAAQRPAAAPAVAAAPRPATAAAALPRTGTGGGSAEQSTTWALAGLAMTALLLGGTGVLAVARRRR